MKWVRTQQNPACSRHQNKSSSTLRQVEGFLPSTEFWRVSREKIIFHEKNLKHKKIILLKNFLFAQTYFLIASSQILKNDAILINHGSFL